MTLEQLLAEIDNRAEFESYADDVELESLNGEYLPEITFEPYGDDN